MEFKHLADRLEFRVTGEGMKVHMWVFICMFFALHTTYNPAWLYLDYVQMDLMCFARIQTDVHITRCQNISVLCSWQ